MGKKIIITERQLKKIVNENIPDFLDDESGVEYDDYDDSMERNMGVEDDFEDENEEDYVSILQRVITHKKDDINKLPGL